MLVYCSFWIVEKALDTVYRHWKVLGYRRLSFGTANLLHSSWYIDCIVPMETNNHRLWIQMFSMRDKFVFHEREITNNFQSEIVKKLSPILKGGLIFHRQGYL